MDLKKNFSRETHTFVDCNVKAIHIYTYGIIALNGKRRSATSNVVDVMPQYDVSGKWKGKGKIRGESVTLWLSFFQEKGTLLGSCTIEYGESKNTWTFSDSLDATNGSFEFVSNSPTRQNTMEFKGRISSSDAFITGNIHSLMNCHDVQIGTWSAARLNVLCPLFLRRQH